jgi:hypothetical protein
MRMAQLDDETVIAQPRVSHHWAGQDSSVRGRFPFTGRLSGVLTGFRKSLSRELGGDLAIFGLDDHDRLTTILQFADLERSAIGPQPEEKCLRRW